MFVMPSYADHSFKGKFVGLSDNLVLGDVELVGLEAACVHTFNHRTRVCTSEEIIKAPPLREALPEAGSWVYPVRATAIPSEGGGFQTIDFSGAFSPNDTNIDCRTWTDLEATGLTVRGLKLFEVRSCDQPRAVACCRAQ